MRQLVAFANPIEESAPPKTPVPSSIKAAALIGDPMNATGVGDDGARFHGRKTATGNGDISDADRVGEALDQNRLFG